MSKPDPIIRTIQAIDTIEEKIVERVDSFFDKLDELLDTIEEKTENE